MTKVTKDVVSTQTTDSAGEVAVFTPKVVKILTMPLIKPAIDVPVYIKITSPMFVGKKIDAGPSKDMEAATLVNCVNLETGEEAQIIVPSVLHGILVDEYENDAYVNKAFAIIKRAKGSGKRYHTFSVAEIEC